MPILCVPTGSPLFGKIWLFWLIFIEQQLHPIIRSGYFDSQWGQMSKYNSCSRRSVYPQAEWKKIYQRMASLILAEEVRNNCSIFQNIIFTHVMMFVIQPSYLQNMLISRRNADITDFSPVAVSRYSFLLM